MFPEDEPETHFNLCDCPSCSEDYQDSLEQENQISENEADYDPDYQTIEDDCD